MINMDFLHIRIGNKISTKRPRKAPKENEETRSRMFWSPGNYDREREDITDHYKFKEGKFYSYKYF